MKMEYSAIKYFNDKTDDFSFMTKSRPEFWERYSVFQFYIEKYKLENAVYLDLGAGNGMITDILKKYGYTVAIDGSESMVELLMQRNKEELNNNKLSVYNYTLPLPDNFVLNNLNKYGIIVLSSVIEYIEKDDLLLKQISSMLKNNGVLIMSYPNIYSIYRILEKYFIKYFRRKSYLSVVKKFYSLNDIKNISEKYNLKILESTYFSLPYHKYTKKLFKHKRPKILSTLGIVIITKNSNK